MSHRGHVIDTRRFAREGRSLEGRLALADLPRAGAEILRVDGPLSYTLSGLREDGKAFLDLVVSGEVWLRCQRCLGELPFRLRLAGRLLLVAEGDDWPDEELADDRYDAIPDNPSMDVVALIEDEVLLALPIAPRHDACDVPGHEGTDERPSPFGVLERLKRH